MPYPDDFSSKRYDRAQGTPEDDSYAADVALAAEAKTILATALKAIEALPIPINLALQDVLNEVITTLSTLTTDMLPPEKEI